MTKPNLLIEQSYPDHLIICGIDEAGRGPLMGPVVAAAVILEGALIEGMNDSKKLSPKTREKLYEQITNCYHYAVGIASIEEIEEFNILNATKLACLRAAENLPVKADVTLIDGNMKFDRADFISIVKGDSKSLSIAAASIVAKVTRDRIVNGLAQEYPQYLWHQNKGYGTSAHIRAIKDHGLTIHHRRSFCSNILL